MNGKTIKDVLSQKGIAQAEIAKILGITPNNLNNMLAKEDVRTGLLESIAEAANIPISVFYGETYTISGCNNATGNHSNNTVNASPDSNLLNMLTSKDKQLTLCLKQTEKAMDQTSEAMKQTTFAMEQAYKSQEQVDKLIKMLNR